MTMITPYYTFPAVGWWAGAVKAEKLVFEVHEHYTKMSDRNRYRISGANNSILLTVPLLHGREQRTPISEVRIANDGRWQVQHWRSLFSAYNRSPYFFHYAPELEKLLNTHFELLIDFNRAAYSWVAKQVGMSAPVGETAGFLPHYPAEYYDFRKERRIPVITNKEYTQVFGDRTGFVPGLSILDLLFAEGPRAGQWLREVIKG